MGLVTLVACRWPKVGGIKLRNELDLYQEFREEMMKKKGDRFEMECQPGELTRLFEEWKKIRKR